MFMGSWMTITPCCRERLGPVPVKPGIRYDNFTIET